MRENKLQRTLNWSQTMVNQKPMSANPVLIKVSKEKHNNKPDANDSKREANKNEPKK